MIIYPSIDVRGGKVVRLREGDPDRQITFSDDPVATAQRWIDDGAHWIHMVNLDGAFAQANDNSSILEQVTQLGIPIQFGGGLRSFDDIKRALDDGARRVILGTIAVEQPELVKQAVERWGVKGVGVALDARNGKVATRGWQNVTDLTPVELGKQMAAYGVIHALYTDVSRDGGLAGANLDSTITLGRETGLQIIASGGVTTIDEIRQLAQSGMVAGAVIGMALYEGRLTLQQALEAAEG
jgi:phosphoribosylformimino-5-aminoimidazole carboxamide ribotide isomerase